MFCWGIWVCNHVVFSTFWCRGFGCENEDRNERSDILCCKCLLKLLCVEYPCSLAICSNLVGSLF